MKTLTTLRIPHLQVVRMGKPTLSEIGNTAGEIISRFTLRLGEEVEFSNIGLSYNPDNPQRPWTIYTANGNFRTFDTPIGRQIDPRTGPYLDNELMIFVSKLIDNNKDQLTYFFTVEGAIPPKFPASKPSSWTKNALCLPIEFITLGNLRAEEGIAGCDIRFGNHFVLWQCRLLDQGEIKLDSRILNASVRQIIKQRIASHAVLDSIKGALTQTFPELVIKIPEGIDVEKVTPQSVYFE